MEDVLYYSTNCPHCQRLLEYLARNGITNKFNFLSIDRRMRDPATGQILLILDRGTKVSLPPNIHNVPSLMLPKQSYRVLIGNDIYTYLESMVNKITNEVTRNNGEPSGFLLGSGQNMSEQFTYYNMTPEELGAKGKGPMRQLLNYVPATHETGNQHIEALPDNYKTDRLKEGDVNMESLEQRRNMEIAPLQQNGPLAGINANHMLPPPHPQQQAPPSMMPSTSSASGPGFSQQQQQQPIVPMYGMSTYGSSQPPSSSSSQQHQQQQAPPMYSNYVGQTNPYMPAPPHSMMDNRNPMFQSKPPAQPQPTPYLVNI